MCFQLPCKENSETNCILPVSCLQVATLFVDSKRYKIFLAKAPLNCRLCEHWGRRVLT